MTLAIVSEDGATTYAKATARGLSSEWKEYRAILIGYDALNSFGSPSYYAIQMFSRNVGAALRLT